MKHSESFEEFFGISEKVTFRIIVTNACNLHCTFCDVGCDQPIKKSSSHIFRQTAFNMDEKSAEDFCQSFIGIGETNLHVIQGGEATMLPIKRLSKIIDIFSDYGRKIGLKTTGYNLNQLPVDSLNKLSHITLTDHGTNEVAINVSKKYLELHYKGKWGIDVVTEHRNTQEIMKHNLGTINQGLSCEQIMSTMTFISPVLYPCCNSWAIMHNLNEDKLRQALILAGWTIDNPNLLQTIRNWRQTLPSMFLKSICAKSCYKTYSNNVESVKIQPHPKDKIIKCVQQ